MIDSTTCLCAGCCFISSCIISFLLSEIEHLLQIWGSPAPACGSTWLITHHCLLSQTYPPSVISLWQKLHCMDVSLAELTSKYIDLYIIPFVMLYRKKADWIEIQIHGDNHHFGSLVIPWCVAFTPCNFHNHNILRFVKKENFEDYANKSSCLKRVIDGDTCILWFSENIVDTIWSSPRYHGDTYQCKIWPVVIIFAQRWFFRVLKSTWSLESTRHEY